MRVDCPTCAASYDIPDRLLVRGRKTRCARCSSDWLPVPADPDDAPPVSEATDADQPDPDPPLAAEHDDVPPADAGRLAVASQPAGASLALKAAWAISLLALILLATGVIVWRDDVVRHWPASERLLGGAAPSAQ